MKKVLVRHNGDERKPIQEIIHVCFVRDGLQAVACSAVHRLIFSKSISTSSAMASAVRAMSEAVTSEDSESTHTHKQA